MHNLRAKVGDLGNLVVRYLSQGWSFLNRVRICGFDAVNIGIYFNRISFHCGTKGGRRRVGASPAQGGQFSTGKGSIL